MWDRRARVVRVKDGDTLIMLLDQGFRQTLEVDVRLLGVWAPELRAVNGAAAKAYIEQWLADTDHGQRWPYIVTTALTADHETKTFDRYVATITTIDGSHNLNVEAEQHYREQGYSGGTGS